MKTYTIKPVREWRVIIAGDVDDARNAVAARIGASRPMRNVSKSAHAIHATVWAERSELDSWFADGDTSSGRHRVGDLCFYIGQEDAEWADDAGLTLEVAL